MTLRRRDEIMFTHALLRGLDYSIDAALEVVNAERDDSLARDLHVAAGIADGLEGLVGHIAEFDVPLLRRHVGQAGDLAKLISRVNARAIATGLSLGDDFAYAVECASGVAACLTRACGAGQVAPFAALLVTTAIRMVPTNYRLQYGEEFRAELDEVAGGGRRAQVAYAARQLASSWQLRAELLRLRDYAAETAPPEPTRAPSGRQP